MGALRSGVARRVRALRKAANLTQQALADKANVDGKYLGSIERSEKNVSIDVLERILHALDIEPFEFFSFRRDGEMLSERSDELTLGRLLKECGQETRRKAIDLVKHVVRATRGRTK